MRIGLAADPHLDKKLGGRTDAAGVNLRSLDLERALARVVDGFIEQRVDMACFLGDLFDNAKPSERARQVLLAEIRRLAEALPTTTIVLLRGNHDAPPGFLAGTAVGTTAMALPGVEVADRFETRIVRRDEVTLTLIPWMRSDEELIAALAEARPEPGRHNLLLLHAGFADLEEFAAMRPGSQTVTRALVPGGFDHIFSGHFHGHRDFAEIGWTYVGSCERLSVSEARSPKGFLVWDTVARDFTFHRIETRSWYDLGCIDGRSMTAAEVNARLDTLAAGLPDWDQALVRVRIDELAPEVYAAVDQVRINRLRARAFWADIELRPRVPELGPATGDEDVDPMGDGAEGLLLLDLEAEWSRWVAGLPGRSDAERARLATLGADALRTAAAAD